MKGAHYRSPVLLLRSHKDPLSCLGKRHVVGQWQLRIGLRPYVENSSECGDLLRGEERYAWLRDCSLRYLMPKQRFSFLRTSRLALIFCENTQQQVFRLDRF